MRSDTSAWLTAAGIVLGALIAGLLTAKLVASRVKHAATLTAFGAGEIVAGALRPVVALWVFTAGVYAARVVLEDRLTPRLDRIVDRLLLAILILSVTLAAARLAADLVRLYALKTSGAVSSSSLFVGLARGAVFLVGLLILLESLGVSVGPLIAALGVGGLAIALALQPTLANLFSGVQLLASGKLKPGDFINVEGGYEGYVEDINWRNTTLRQLGNNRIVIPNGKLAERVITNLFLADREMSVLVPVAVSAEADLAAVEQAIIETGREAIAETPGTPAGFEPSVRFQGFAGPAIVAQAVLRVGEVGDRALLVHTFVRRLHARFRRDGIELASPVGFPPAN